MAGQCVALRLGLATGVVSLGHTLSPFCAIADYLLSLNVKLKVSSLWLVGCFLEVDVLFWFDRSQLIVIGESHCRISVFALLSYSDFVRAFVGHSIQSSSVYVLSRSKLETIE